MLWFGIILLVLVIFGFLWYFTTHRASTPTRKKSPPGRKPTGPQPSVHRTDPSYWEQIKIGDVVTLTDEQTLELLMKEERMAYTSGLRLTVKGIRDIHEQYGAMKWLLCEFEPVRFRGGDQVWYLLIKKVDDLFDLRILFIPSQFTPGTRQQLLDEGLQWLFQPPANEHNFHVNDLLFTEEIEQTLDQGGTIVYKLKPQGALQATMTEKPSSGPSSLSVSILEYRTDAAVENPELLLLEIEGPGAASEGGFVLMFQGTNVGINDLDLSSV